MGSLSSPQQREEAGKEPRGSERCKNMGKPPWGLKLSLALCTLKAGHGNCSGAEFSKAQHA